MNIYMYFLLFLIYSVIGWIVEVINVSIIEKRFINRGFLMGPYCPIYGFGGLLSYLLLKKYLDDPIALFMMAILIFSILELHYCSQRCLKLFSIPFILQLQ